MYIIRKKWKSMYWILERNGRNRKKEKFYKLRINFKSLKKNKDKWKFNNIYWIKIEKWFRKWKWYKGKDKGYVSK